MEAPFLKAGRSVATNGDGSWVEAFYFGYLAFRCQLSSYFCSFGISLADMSQPDSQRGETDAPVAEKREHGVVNSAARVRQILGPAIAARL
jgi:hypothetical protein